MVKFICLSFLLVLYEALAQKYTLTTVSDNDAKCLDGSTPKFYLYENSASAKWIIFFQGGGNIALDAQFYNVSFYEAAYGRTKTYLGSSSQLSDQQTFYGIMSNSKTQNPNFYQYNKVYINYCDGTHHQGYISQPVNIGVAILYFRGSLNTKGVFTTLQQQTKIDDATQIIVSGCSAGSIGVFYWTNYIKQLFSSAKVLAVPDSGLFFPLYPNLTYIETKPGFYDIVNKEIDPPNSECVTKNNDKKWRCLLTENLADYMQASTFIVEPEYDQYMIQYLAGYTCTQIQKNSLSGSLESCFNTNATLYANQYRTISNDFLKMQMENHVGWGVWAPACFQHCMLEQYFTDSNYSVPANSQNTMSRALGLWVENQVGDESHVYIDEVEWPDNVGCNHVKDWKKIEQYRFQIEIAIIGSKMLCLAMVLSFILF